MAIFWIGVDGGASKSVIRVEDEKERVIGCEVAGPANIRLSVSDSWAAIGSALTKILQREGLALNQEQHTFYAGMGLAGSEIAEAERQFKNCAQGFRRLLVTSDAHVACLGAHGGGNGGVIIIGTGLVGLQIEEGQINKVGGWGFPHDDEGGGAWLGMRAVSMTLKWLDGRIPSSPLSKAIYAHFGGQDALVNFANQANSTAFATLAPFVIELARANDGAAISLLKQAAKSVDELACSLIRDEQNTLPLSLLGSIAPHLQPWLSETLITRLIEPKGSAQEGAILFIKQQVLKGATS